MRSRLAEITLDKPVPKCRRVHSRADRRLPEYKDCYDCQARNRWVKLIAEDERRRGVYRTLVDVEIVQQRVRELVESGHTRESISAESGVSTETISTFMRSGVKKVHPFTYDGIMSVKPSTKPTHKHYKGEAADLPHGTIRRICGLVAQGWTMAHMADVLGVQRSYICAIPRRPDRLVIASTIEKFKRLADKLGPYDFADLDEPLPGMSIKSVRLAEKRGWVPLRDWDDIDDPDAEPHRPESLDASNGMVLVDPAKVELALEFRVREELRPGRGYVAVCDRFVLPFTRLEMYEIIRIGSERDYAGESRFSANLLGQRLGISERTVQRHRGELAAIDALLDAAPPLAGAVAAAELILATSEWPATLRLHAVAELLGRYPIGAPSFYRHLVILSATQPSPQGRRWSDAELAAWLGCTDEEATTLRTRAILAARQYRDVRPGEPGRSRSAGTELPATTGGEQRCAA